MITTLLLSLTLAKVSAPVWTAKVGDYSVAKWINARKELETLFLKDPKGRVVATITDSRVGVDGNFWDRRPIQTSDVNRDGVPEILIETWTGGAHGSISYHLWSLGKHPRCLIAYDKNNISDQHDFVFVDLDGDGIQEIRTWYDGFAYTVGGSNWQDLPIVLRYEGGRYVERTSRYPKLLKKAKSNVLRDLAEADKKEEPGTWGWCAASAVNLIALDEMANDKGQVWRVLRKELPEGHLRWLRKHESLIRDVIRGRSHRYEYPKAYRPKPVQFRIFPTPEMAKRFED